MSESDPSGPVDRYLDELFDRLNGTGGVGRRALAEAEDHLRTATADAVQRGTPPAEAEREAVTRFGAASSFAGPLRRVQRRGPLGVLLSSGWLLVGLGLAALSAVYLLTGLDRAIETSLHPCTARCVPAGTDSLLGTGIVLAAVAAAVLVGRVLARRRTDLPSSATWLPVVAAVLGALAAVAAWNVFSPIGLLDIDQYVPGSDGSPGPYFSGMGTVTGVAACLAAAAWAVVQHRRRAVAR